jgi:hypothetical protein
MAEFCQHSFDMSTFNILHYLLMSADFVMQLDRYCSVKFDVEETPIH